MKTTPSPKQSRLFRNDTYFSLWHQRIWKSHNEVVTGFDAPTVMKTNSTHKWLWKLSIQPWKTPKNWSGLGFLYQPAGFMAAASACLSGRLGELCWWGCMFQSATLKSHILLPNAKMFLSKCKMAYLRAWRCESKNKSIYKLFDFHAKQAALTVTDSCSSALVVQNVNAAICGARQVSLKT